VDVDAIFVNTSAFFITKRHADMNRD